MDASDDDGRPKKYISNQTMKQAALITGLGSAVAVCSKAMNPISTTSSISEITTEGLLVDLSRIPKGTTYEIYYCGEPIFIRNRTMEEIIAARTTEMTDLIDPQKDADRALRPQWLIMIGVCSHMGCTTIDGGAFGGWFCPCHESLFDTSGRVRSPPAMYNLATPEYRFVDKQTLLILPLAPQQLSDGPATGVT